MFMSIEKTEILRSRKDLVNFILEKEKIGLPDKYKLFLYSTLSPKKRMFGYSYVYDEKLGMQKWAEINFQPFGYLLAEDSGPAHEHMCEISNFGDFKYNEVVNIQITTVYLNVDSPIIGRYK